MKIKSINSECCITCRYLPHLKLEIKKVFNLYSVKSMEYKLHKVGIILYTLKARRMHTFNNV